MIIMKCRKCKKEIDHPRRGMCLNCYRKVTGLSKSKTKIKPTITIRRTPLIENKKEKESLSTKWWKKYLEADMLKQQDLLASLPLVKELAKRGFPNLAILDKYKGLSKEELEKEQEKFNSHMLTTMLYSYINDLIELNNTHYYIQERV
jgi:hypothetical protein